MQQAMEILAPDLYHEGVVDKKRRVSVTVQRVSSTGQKRHGQTTVWPPQ